MAGRRPNHSGSVRKVSENKYVAEITVGLKENGKPNKNGERRCLCNVFYTKVENNDN